MQISVQCYTSWHLKIVLILEIFAAYREWVNQLAIVLGTWFYEHPHCTDSDILLFLFPLRIYLVDKSVC